MLVFLPDLSSLQLLMQLQTGPMKTDELANSACLFTCEYLASIHKPRVVNQPLEVA